MRIKLALTLSQLCLGASLLLAVAPDSCLARNGDDDDQSSSSSSSASSSSFSNSSGSSSSATSGGGVSSSSSSDDHATRIRAPLAPTALSESLASGRVEYRRRSSQSPARFLVKVLIPIGGTVPHISDSSAAGSLALTAHVVRGDSVISSCALELNRITNSQSQGEIAEYKAEVRAKSKGRVRTKSGECTSVQNASVVVPSLRRNDVVEVHSPDDGVFLERVIH